MARKSIYPLISSVLVLGLLGGCASGDDIDPMDGMDDSYDDAGDGDGDGDSGDGDGDGDSGDGDGDSGDGDGDEMDTEAPTIVSITPEDGATGVLPDEVIVIQFSEPMDKVATQAAYGSPDLTVAQVTMSWNDDGDILTITPNDPLTIAEGEDPEQVEALTYEWAISSVAADKAGNELEDDAYYSFQVARRILHSTPLLGKLTGSIVKGTPDPWLDGLVAGDSSQNLIAAFCTSFDITYIEPEVLTFESATLSLDQIYASPGVYEALKNLQIVDVEFVEFGEQTFDAGPGETMGMFSDSEDLQAYTYDVTDWLEADHEADRDQTQFRFEFEDVTDWDLQVDAVSFDIQTAALDVSYLIE